MSGSLRHISMVRILISSSAVFTYTTNTKIEQCVHATLFLMDEPLTKLEPKDFPPLLHEIPDVPKQLWLRGTLPSQENTRWLAVVGSRAYTPYGKQACESLIRGLAGYPIVIVSGLALGIDGIAHKAALDAGLTTVAIPGSGLDRSVLYPRTNFQLAKRIIEAGGAHLSEFDPKFEATPWSFIQRNRIMAGITHATLVIEATEKSGTLVTAKLATDYNRDVLCVPGPIFSETSKGTNLFLRLGATPIGNSEHLLDALGFAAQPPLPLAERSDLSGEEKAILALLTEPLPRDELIRASKLPASLIGSILSAMELKGLIEESMGKIRALV